ncbi:MAG: type III pantothenate kinase [Nitrospirae bacterium]|nr:type III pantothenate kinase [Nitrospirota bacterium]
MLLAIDIGNTNIVAGVFDGPTLSRSWRIGTKLDRTADEYALVLSGLYSAAERTRRVSQAVLSSVVPPLEAVLVEAVFRSFGVSAAVVKAGWKTGLTLDIDRPDELGADRLVNAAAAFRRFGGPLVVVDFGTATTFCAVTAEGVYKGGAILPGVEVGLDALSARTAKLPRIPLAAPPRAIGTNTVAAMQSGIVYGTASLVDGMAARFGRELGEKPRGVATGGLAGVVARHCRSIREIVPDLTLEGLRLLYDLNFASDSREAGKKRRKR